MTQHISEVEEPGWMILNFFFAIKKAEMCGVYIYSVPLSQQFYCKYWCKFLRLPYKICNNCCKALLTDWLQALSCFAAVKYSKLFYCFVVLLDRQKKCSETYNLKWYWSQKQVPTVRWSYSEYISSIQQRVSGQEGLNTDSK